MSVNILRLSAETFEEAVNAAVNALLGGGIVALPTDTIYGISTLLPFSNRLYSLKKRPFEKPLGVFLPSARELSMVTQQSVSLDLLDRLLPGPVTLLFERGPLLPVDFNPSVPNIGVRVPLSPLISAIGERLAQPIAQTSANVSGSSLNPTKITDFEDLFEYIDLVIDGGEIDVDNGSGSTIVDLTLPGRFTIVRDGCAKKQTVRILKQHKLMSTE